MIVQRNTSRQRNRRGFTLMEVLVVVAILVILAGTASIFLFRYLDDAKTNRAQADLQTLTKACQSYKIKYQDYPASLQELVNPPEGGKPYLTSADALNDPWGKPYQYNPSGDNNRGLAPDIWTVNPDGEQIANWDTVRQR
jgi:general secretion pathway protein G